MKLWIQIIITGIVCAFCLTIVYTVHHSKSTTLPTVSLSFKDLPAWNSLDHQKSLNTFQNSCRVIVKQHPLHSNAQPWFSICQQALQLPSQTSTQQAKTFFEENFIIKASKEPSLFTGYYSPSYEGRLQADATFHYPIYGLPQDLISLNLKDFISNPPTKMLYGKIINQHFVPYDRRIEIAQGSLKHRAKVLAWLKDPIDAIELEIQGTGIIRTPQKQLILNYAGQNGHRYRSIGRILIHHANMPKHEVTMKKIHQYFSEHPQELYRILKFNPSYVFFKLVDQKTFLGYQNINLSPGYSMAVDPKFIAMGTPIFISTTLPNRHPLHRLVIAQDIGGAIKGPGRGDIYWGEGKRAQYLASDMKQSGKMWYLLPRIHS